ncbi:MAG: metal-dependent transcriptional regulator [Acidimicrobiia bacterium]
MADLHDSTEHYLATIYEVEEEGIEIKRARIAERLGISAPSVTEHIHRMEKQGLVQVSTNNSVSLTKQGRERAVSVVRRHRIAERLLVDIIGLDWSKAHNEADKWEHVISDEVEENLMRILKDPQTCPHGNPIPNRDGTYGEDYISQSKKISQLSTFKPGTEFTIRRIGESIEVNAEYLDFVSDNKLFPGHSAKVISKSVSDIEVELETGSQIVIPVSIARSMYAQLN